jgi:hypothetical protein
MTTPSINPKVFVSHASEDKERFVLDFAAKLRAKGIDAWLDKWEILPGDSLIDKLFEEGIKNAQAVIVVVSNFSVNKAWVREELNAAMVKKINSGSKLIPVVIDDCQVPEALQSTVWEKIEDLNNYDAELERIVRAIYEHREKPPLGSPPAYTKTLIEVIPNLTNIDSLVIKLSCEKAIEQGYPWVEPSDVWERAKTFGIGEEEFYETLEILHSRRFIEGHKVADGTDRINRFQITTFGFDQYSRVYIKDYNLILKSVALQIINHNQTESINIASALHQPLMVVNHIFEVFEQQGWIGVNRIATGDNNLSIYQVRPEFKRWVRSI